MNLKDKTVVINNKTYCYSKIVMLHTNDIKQSSILLGVMPNWCQLTKEVINDLEWLKFGKPQHLYFLSLDKICEGDWFIANNGVHKCLEIVKGNYPYKVSNQYNNGEIQYQSKHWIGNKVIASTDPSLNLPKPSDSFLQVYIDAYNKNEKIEECLVEYEEILGDEGIISHVFKENEFKPKTTKEEITIRKIKESWSMEEILTDIENAMINNLTLSEYRDTWIM